VDATDHVVAVPAGSGGAKLAEFGLVHTGQETLIFNQGDPQPLPFSSKSVLNFVRGFGMSTADTNDVTLFVRQLDTGVAPIVGKTLTVDMAAMTEAPGDIAAQLDLMEGQARAANAGLAVHARLAGVERGLWYDVTNAARPYVEQAQSDLTPIGPFSRSELIALVSPSGGDPDNLLVFQSTALGSERRTAYLDGGVPPKLATQRPRNIVLLPSRPDTANVAVPRMTRNWLDGMTGGLFNTLFNNKSVIWFQVSLLEHAASASVPSFGLTGYRHDAPRRLRVRADDVKQGAWLRLYAPIRGDITTATKTTPPTTVPNPGRNPTAFEMPLHPAIDANGSLVWETAEELDTLQMFAMLNGGPNNPTVALALQNPNHQAFQQQFSTDLMQPLLWNWWYVEVVNDRADSSKTASGGWQRLTVD
jgi:hypothetical protein